MARNGKSKPNGDNGGRTVPARQDVETVETADIPEDEIERTAPAQSVADKENTPKLGTEQNQNKLTPLSRLDLSNSVEIIRAEIELTSKILDLIPDGLSGPLATLVKELRR